MWKIQMNDYNFIKQKFEEKINKKVSTSICSFWFWFSVIFQIPNTEKQHLQSAYSRRRNYNSWSVDVHCNYYYYCISIRSHGFKKGSSMRAQALVMEPSEAVEWENHYWRLRVMLLALDIRRPSTQRDGMWLWDTTNGMWVT